MKRVVLCFSMSVILLPMLLPADAQQSSKSEKSISDHRYSIYIAGLKQETVAPVHPGEISQPEPAAKATAHHNLEAGITIEAGLPLGKLKDESAFVLSVNAEARYFLDEEIAVMFSAGFSKYFGKTRRFTEYNGNGEPQSFSIKTKALHGIPVQAGGSILLTNAIFLQASAGVSFLSDGGGTAFIYSPAIGYRLNQIEARLKYEGLSKNGTLSFAGIQLGYFIGRKTFQ
jgi:hypothetical protein